MKKILSLIVLMLIVFSLASCGGEKSIGNRIPDVFGIDYEDAIEILEADGFEVNAIGANVESISTKLLYPLEKVDKGSVFKIDDYVLDEKGHLTKNYDVFYDGELVSEDKSVVIYYAKDDYVLEKEDVPKDDTTSPLTTSIPKTTTPSTTSMPVTTAPDTTANESEKENTDNNVIDPDFKAAMDSYEKFFDEYVAIMKKYTANPADMSILSDYLEYMGQYADMMEKFENWENEDLNVAETAYYIEVQGRITKKLLEIAK